MRHVHDSKSVRSTKHRGRRWARLSLLLAAFALPLGVHAHELLAVKTYYKPAASGGGIATKSGRGAQPSQTWQGSATVPDPGGLNLLQSTYEFDVLSNYNNGSMSVAIRWDAGTAVAYDLDLFVERRDALGNWQYAASSTGGQLLGDGDAVEVASLRAPAPGHYRARVNNYASATLEYTGEVAFAPATKGRLPKGSRERVTTDRPDTTSLAKLHLMYVIPADGVDEQLDLNGVIEDSVASMNAWNAANADGHRWRIDTFNYKNTPLPDITFVRGFKTAAEYAASADGAFTALTDELESRGWIDDPGQKRYLVYYAGPAEDSGICGTAYYSLNTLSQVYAQWSVIFLDAAAGCGSRDFGTPAAGPGMSEAVALQEMIHNEGIVHSFSPHQCWAFRGHICTALAGAATSVVDDLDPESVDVMFPFVTFPLRDKVVDPGHDDYYRHPLPYYDLEATPFFQ
jgi:hypothetical protein